MKMRCCVIPCGQTDRLIKKTFLAFRALLNVRIDPQFPQTGLFYCFQGLRAGCYPLRKLFDRIHNFLGHFPASTSIWQI